MTRQSVSDWTGGFQSTLPTRGSDGDKVTVIGVRRYFNPRSPRGGATATIYYCFYHMFISIHAPHEGERHSTAFHLCFIQQFQSTLPTRGSDFMSMLQYASTGISIHAPHEGERRICTKIRQSA